MLKTFFEREIDICHEKTLQKFSSIHAQARYHFNPECHLVDRQTYKLRRSAALAEWHIVIS